MTDPTTPAACPWGCKAKHGLTKGTRAMHGDLNQNYKVWCGHAMITASDKDRAFAIWNTRPAPAVTVKPLEWTGGKGNYPRWDAGADIWGGRFGARIDKSKARMYGQFPLFIGRTWDGKKHQTLASAKSAAQNAYADILAIQPEAPNARAEALREAVEYHTDAANKIQRMIDEDETIIMEARYGDRMAGHTADADALLALIDQPAPAPTPDEAIEEAIEEAYKDGLGDGCNHHSARLPGSCVVESIWRESETFRALSEPDTPAHSSPKG